MRFHGSFATIALLAAALGCGDATAPDDPIGGTVPVSAAGRVFTLTGAIPTGARFVVASTAGRESTAIAADGSFSIQARAGGPSVDLVVEADGMHPSLVRVALGSALPQLSFVLVPRRWTIRGGTHDGVTVDISPDAAFRLPCATANDTNCDGFYPTAWTGLPRLWPRASLPIRVAFDHARSHQIVSAADSTTFWQIMQRMNADYGTSLFRPAQAEEISIAEDGRPQQAILVRIDTTLTGYSAWTNWWWNGAGEMYAGVVRPRRTSLLASTSLMTHELLHTQGFKHSCSWTTVMGGYPCSSNAGLSAHDVAYAQLAVHIEIVQRQSAAAHSLAAARDGERAVTLGLPVTAVAITSSFSASRGDSIGDALGDHAHAPRLHRELATARAAAQHDDSYTRTRFTTLAPLSPRSRR